MITNFKQYAYDAVHASILSCSNRGTTVTYYSECTIEDYFDSQISGGKLYDSVQEFTEHTLIDEVEELREEFESARYEAFSDWFNEKLDNIDEAEDMIYLDCSDVTVIEHEDTNEDGETFISHVTVEREGKEPDATDINGETNGSAYFETVLFKLMPEYYKREQSVAKAALFCGIKHCFTRIDDEDRTEYYYFKL